MVDRDTQTVTIGVIAAAGQASRMWPASRVFPKELFPIGRLPALIYVVWEMCEAGITNIVIVTRPNGSEPIRRLLALPVDIPKKAAIDPLVSCFERILSKVEFSFVEQSGPYGNGTPLRSSRSRVGDRPCVYAFADDIVFGENISTRLIRTYRSTGYPVLAVQMVDESQKSRFGIVECTSQNGIQYARRIVEKPTSGVTSSNLASFGRYLVTPSLYDEIMRGNPGTDGELWFIDSVISMLHQGLPVCVCPLTIGKWHTIGEPEGFADAVNASQHDIYPGMYSS